MKGPALILALWPALVCAAPAQTVWKAGVAQAVITPGESIWLAGYGDRTRPSDGVLQDIHVKALALDAEAGRPVVIVTADLVGIPREISEPVAARCEKQFQLPRDRLVLNASHTHSAPVMSHSVSPRALDEKQWQAVDRYGTFLIEKMVGVVGAALHDMTPANVKFGQSFAAIAVNRRRAYPNSRSRTTQVDPDVPVMTVTGSDGALRAVLVGYACHATVLNIYKVSGDWPGFAQEDIEKAHPGAVALFMQGAGADSNPLPRRSVELARLYGQVLAAAVEDVLHGPMKPVEGPIRTAYEIVQVPFHNLPTSEELQAKYPTPPRPRVSRWIDALGRGEKLPAYYPYAVQVWQYGGSLRFIALAGEVVSDYSLRLKAQYGWDDTWVAGYSNDVFGYTPSARVLREGGYEADQSGYVSQFSPAIEELIVEKVAALVKRTLSQAGK
jgi:neutral ceramidase